MTIDARAQIPTNETEKWQVLNHLAASTIRAARERSVLTKSALAHPTLAQTALWADTVSRSHHETTQPRDWLCIAAREAAKDAYDSLPGNSTLSAACDWYLRLNNGESEVVKPGEWESFLRSVCMRAITATSSPGDLDRWSRELASGLIEDQRSIDTLNQKLKGILGQQKQTLTNAQHQVQRLLVTAPVDHIVAVGVLGALELKDFQTLVSDGSVSLLTDALSEASFQGWGKAGGRVAEFVRTASNQRLLLAKRNYLVGPRIFLQVLVKAPDPESAGNKALRLVQRILDSYHAAHPTALLSLYSLVAIAEIGSRKDSFTLLDRDERKWDSINLIGFQPLEPLTSALRVNSMIRTAPATVTRASFSWVAFEAAGIKPQEIDFCAKALALLELRQLFFSSYRDFVRHSAASTRSRNDQVRLAENLKYRSRRLRRHRASGQLAEQLNLAALHIDTAALFRRRLSVLHKHQADRVRFLIDQFGVADGGVSYGNPSFATLGDFSGWSVALREWQTGVQSIRGAALDEIAAGILPEHTAELRLLGDLATQPSLLRTRLERRADYFGAQLRALYSARNLHLHNGVHDVPGEVGLAQLGQSMVDAMLEIWSLWLTSNPTMKPLEVARKLATRFDSVNLELDSGRLVENLDAGMIAAPGWSLP
ncbi:hypothetical protein ACSNO4_08355 [Kocuria flava]|uniref:hypothetical protein n=1 Tax=Kocuria flava TaxID=446860 RepID=UPI003F1B9989